MILISKILNRVLFATFLVALTPFLVSAQNSLSLSVSPTLFEMTANPSQEWSSSVRIINPNPYELVVYVEAVNFAPQGEAGQGKFLPVIEDETPKTTLAEWLEFDRTEVVIPAEQTIELPFTIAVPENAQPGGHFAAILVGTKPPENDQQRSRVETSQVVTSLLFLRVSGEVVENGQIRSFRTLDSVLERPEATFEMRFENTGNVHLLPQGEIRILNMWGQERGIVPINRDTMFGNVLPESIRRFTFNWSGDWSIADMGRYTAVATLAYGAEERHFTSSETSFWIIPWREALIVGGIVIGFILFITWALKLYIRRMLSLAVSANDPKVLADVQRDRVVYAKRPIEKGMLDLRQRYAESDTMGQKLGSTFQFLYTYKLFFTAAFVTVAFISGAAWFIQSAATDDRAYQVEVLGNGGSNVMLSSEDVEYENMRESTPVNNDSAEDSEDPGVPVTIVNRSGVSGMAASLRVLLETKDVNVVRLDTDFGIVENNTVIVYAPEYLDTALSLSEYIDGALLSSFEGETDVPITIYVGKDFENTVQ